MELEFEFTKIPGNGYVKRLFSKLTLPPNSQVSSFEWNNGESPWHDHSVDEITLVHKGKLKQTCLVDGKPVVTIHEEGTYFRVPAGTVHKVQAIGEATTVNICLGPLQMKTFQEEDLLEATSTV
ncbi:MAG TPA: cupin domain-containing protein [Candidatus Paceibacterota bacterium]|nr:cupin domain-containing protein [Candidatus Paceibacterota bacterium]